MTLTTEMYDKWLKCKTTRVAMHHAATDVLLFFVAMTFFQGCLLTVWLKDDFFKGLIYLQPWGPFTLVTFQVFKPGPSDLHQKALALKLKESCTEECATCALPVSYASVCSLAVQHGVRESKDLFLDLCRDFRLVIRDRLGKHSSSTLIQKSRINDAPHMR